MKECTCIRYSLQKFVKEELMCREKESHKSHVNHISWLGLTYIMIGVERGGGRREKGVIMQNNCMASYSTHSFPFSIFSLPPPLYFAPATQDILGLPVTENSLD